MAVESAFELPQVSASKPVSSPASGASFEPTEEGRMNLTRKLRLGRWIARRVGIEHPMDNIRETALADAERVCRETKCAALNPNWDVATKACADAIAALKETPRATLDPKESTL